MLTVEVFNREQAIALEPHPDVAFISIWSASEEKEDNGPPTLKEGWAEVLRLPFDDHEPERKVPDTSGLQAFTMDQAREVLAFAEKHEDKTIFVHCRAGVSRSVAIGDFISQQFSRRLVLHAIGTAQLQNGHVRRLLNRLLWMVEKE